MVRYDYGLRHVYDAACTHSVRGIQRLNDLHAVEHCQPRSVRHNRTVVATLSWSALVSVACRRRLARLWRTRGAINRADSLTKRKPRRTRLDYCKRLAIGGPMRRA